MFTAIATLQLVEAGKLALDDPIGKHLTDYPNKDVASKVTVRHLLTHTGGTGDIFGPEFTKNRLTLREHGDYVKLYGARALDARAGRGAPVFELRLRPARRAHREGERHVVLRLRARRKVFQPAGMTSTDSLPETENVPKRAIGYMKRRRRVGAEYRHAAVEGHGGGWRLLDRRRSLPLRAGAGVGKADLESDARRGDEGAASSSTGTASAFRAKARLRSYGHGGGAPGMNGDLRVFPELGTSLSA